MPRSREYLILPPGQRQPTGDQFWCSGVRKSGILFSHHKEPLRDEGDGDHATVGIELRYKVVDGEDRVLEDRLTSEVGLRGCKHFDRDGYCQMNNRTGTYVPCPIAGVLPLDKVRKIQKKLHETTLRSDKKPPKGSVRGDSI